MADNQNDEDFDVNDFLFGDVMKEIENADKATVNNENKNGNNNIDCLTACFDEDYDDLPGTNAKPIPSLDNDLNEFFLNGFDEATEVRLESSDSTAMPLDPVVVDMDEVTVNPTVVVDPRYVRPTDTPMANLMPPEFSEVDIRLLYPAYDKDKPPRFGRLFTAKYDIDMHSRGLDPHHEEWRMRDKELDNRPHVVANGIDLGVEPTEANCPPTYHNVLFQWEKVNKSQTNKTDRDQDKKADKTDLSTCEEWVPTWRCGAAKLWYDRLGLTDDVDIESLFDPRVTELRGLAWQVTPPPPPVAVSQPSLAETPSTSPPDTTATGGGAATTTTTTSSITVVEKDMDTISNHSDSSEGHVIRPEHDLHHVHTETHEHTVIHHTHSESEDTQKALKTEPEIVELKEPENEVEMVVEGAPVAPPERTEDQESSGESQEEDTYTPERISYFRLINWEDDVIWDADTEHQKIQRSFKLHSPYAGWVPTEECRTLVAFQKKYASDIPGILLPRATGMDQEHLDPRRVRSILPPRRTPLYDASWMNHVAWDVNDLLAMPAVLPSIELQDTDNWQLVQYHDKEVNAYDEYRRQYRRLCLQQLEKLTKNSGVNTRLWPRRGVPPAFTLLTQVRIKSTTTNNDAQGGSKEPSIIPGLGGDGDLNEAQHSRGPLKIRQPSKAAARMGDHNEKAKQILGRHGLLHEEEEESEPVANQMEEEELSRLLALQKRDPFNVSQDEHYSYYSNDSQLCSLNAGGMLTPVDVQHSIPALELYPAFFPTYLNDAQARQFYRPPLRIRNLRTAKGIVKLFNRELSIYNLKRFIDKKARERKLEQEATGGGQVFFMRTPEDLSAMDGHLLLMEYSEEFPPVLAQPGMASRILNYYRRGFNPDGSERPPPKMNYGENTFTHKPPYMGQLKPGQTLQSLENRMFRAPIFEHKMPSTDFLIVRSRSSFYIRHVETIFSVGQVCPLIEVPAPNSKKAAAFTKDFLKVYIERLFLKSELKPPRIKIEDVRRAFPNHSETSVRKRLKEVAEFNRTGTDASWWVYKVGMKGMPSEHALRRIITPEDCCAYYSMIHASQRLKDAGYKAMMDAEGQENEQDDNQTQTKLADEMKAAPWHTTNAFISAQKGKCFLELHGAADPTGHGEALSYAMISGKTGAQVLRSIAEGNDGLAQWMNQPLPGDVQGVGQPSGFGVGPGRRMVTGTDADLRKLTLPQAKQMLRNHGIPESEIKKLKRWDIVNVVRALSTEKAKKGEQEGMAKFARGGRMSGSELQERYREELQRMFELQNRVLASDEQLSTDEATTSEEDNSEVEEVSKHVESMLKVVNRGASSAAVSQKQKQMQLQKEEADRRELLTKGLSDAGKNKMRDPSAALSMHPIDKMLMSQPPPPLGAVKKALRITRTYAKEGGGTYIRSCIVPWSQEVDFYLEARKWTEEKMRTFAGATRAMDREERRREKRRLQDRLRRIKKQEMEQERRRQEGNLPEMNRPKKPTVGGSSSSKKPPTVRRITQVCGACGTVGHMRTNKCCPLYNQTNANANKTPAKAGESSQSIEKGAGPSGGGSAAAAAATSSSSARKSTSASARRRSKEDDAMPQTDAFKELQRVTVSELLHREIPLEHEPLPFEDKNLVTMVGQTKLRIDRRLFELEEERAHRDMHLTIPRHVIDKLQRVEAAEHKATMEKQRHDLGKKKLSTPSGGGGGGGSGSHLGGSHTRSLQRGDYSTAEKNKGNRRRIDPIVALNHVLETMYKGLTSSVDGYQYFLHPVNKREYPDYYDVITSPMDLTTIRRKIQENEYQSRKEFIDDISLIKNNCARYNGESSTLTVKATDMVTFVWEQLLRKENKLMRYERLINPLLDEDVVAFGYYLTQAIEAMKGIEHSLSFQQPVDKKRYKAYYDIIKQPMDLSKMESKIKEKQYFTCDDFLSDVDLMVRNCVTFNSEAHPLTKTVYAMAEAARKKLQENQKALEELEQNLRESRQQDEELLSQMGVDSESVVSRHSPAFVTEIYDETISLSEQYAADSSSLSRPPHIQVDELGLNLSESDDADEEPPEKKIRHNNASYDKMSETMAADADKVSMSGVNIDLDLSDSNDDSPEHEAVIPDCGSPALSMEESNQLALHDLRDDLFVSDDNESMKSKSMDGNDADDEPDRTQEDEPDGVVEEFSSSSDSDDMEEEEDDDNDNNDNDNDDDDRTSSNHGNQVHFYIGDSQDGYTNDGV